MAEIKAGMIVSMRTTGDEMFVLKLGQVPEFHALAGTLSGTEVTVRRPIITEKGTIQYQIEHYFLEELETKQEGILRNAAEIEELKSKFKANQPSQASGAKPTLSN